MTMKFNEIDSIDDKVLKLRPNTPSTIIVIGCGGTGSYLIPDLARAISFSRFKPAMILIDGDFVEEKNIKRQNFIDKDRGQNKAMVLARRYGQAFGMDISYLDEFLKDKDHLNNIIKSNIGNTNDSHLKSTLIISCVDRNAVRRVIQETMLDILAKPRGYRNPMTWWLDSGNEDTYGQVVLSTATPFDLSAEEKRITDSLYSISRMHPTSSYGDGFISLPQLKDIFPHIMLDAEEAAPTVSCAEQAIRDPQNLLINRMAATIALEYAYKFLYNQYITSFMSSFNSTTGEVHKTLLTKNNLTKVFHDAYPDHPSVKKMYGYEDNI